MMLATILFLAQSSSLDQKVSFDIKGGDGKDLATTLTRKTGIHFETNDEASAERYVIHIENTPLSEAMDRIADAEHGEWHPMNGGFVLRRSAVRVAEAIDAHRAETIRSYKRALAVYRKQLSATPDFSDQAAHDLAHAWRKLGPQPNNGENISNTYWEQQTKLQNGMPLGRAFMRMMLTFTPAQLADMSVEEPTVYSTKPTAMQVQLPDGAFTALGDLVNEQLTWEDAVAKFLPDRLEESWNGMATQGKIRQIANALVSINRWDENSGSQCHLLLSDNKNRVVTETYLYMQPAQDDSKAPQPEVAKKPEKKIPLPAVDISLAKAFANSFEDAKGSSQFNDAARTIAIDPEKFDPLSTFVSDGLIGLAKVRHENLAAVIDDRAMAPCAYAISKDGMDPKVLDYLNGWSSQSVIESKGWLVLSEKRPDRADEIRADRHALHEMLDAARANGRLKLDDAAAYALTSPRFNEDPIPQAYLTGLLEKQGGRTLQENDKNLLRFYGSLDSRQRLSKELPLSSLSGFQVSLVAKMLYGNNSNLNQTYTEPPQPDANGQYENFWETLAREPTFSFGNGVPGSGKLTMTASNDHAILARMRYGTWDQGVQTYDARSLGWMIASSGTGDGNYPWTVVGLRPADRAQITFDFKYSDKLSQNFTLQDVLPIAPETAFLEKLPDDLRHELSKAIDEAKKQVADQGPMRWGNGGGFGSGQPPR